MNQINDEFDSLEIQKLSDLKNEKDKYVKGFSDLLDTPFSKYQIQLNYYQQLVEQVPGVKISKRKIYRCKIKL